MTLEELNDSSIKEVAEWMVKLDACPCNSGEEEVCVVDSEGDNDCRKCWEMHLNGESRDDADGYDEAKRTGRGRE